MTSSEQKRLFVGNLPPDIQDHEIKAEFSYYGPVDKVEIKQKKATDSDEVQNTFAFVTIAIDEHALQQCLQEFKAQPYRGQYLQVTVARENFLEKLKREREEAAQFKPSNTSQSSNTHTEIVNATLPTISTGNSDESESSSSESSEDENPSENPSAAKRNGVKKIKSSASDSSDSNDSQLENNQENLILKKKSKIFLENGKIKIDRNVSTGEAIHVIVSKSQKTTKKELDEKSKRGDQKRLESLKKMKSSYNEQKLAIKKALARVDTVQKSNKIVFDDDEDDYGGKSTPSIRNQIVKKLSEAKQNERKTTTKKPTLFDDNDSDGDADFERNFEIKEQFEGEKGEKLRRLQDRFQGDNRFKMDSRFLEDDGDGNDKDVATQMHSDKRTNDERTENIETNESDERQWQMKILESVMGKRIQSTFKSKEAHKKATPSMLRFDPTRAEHTKFVEPKVKKRKTKVINESETKRQKIDTDNREEKQSTVESVNDQPPVSMEHFYEVRGDLKKSLGAGGFSLLSMFNRPTDDDDDDAAAADVAAKKPYEEKSINKNGVKFLANFDPFKYDSSGDEVDDHKNQHSVQKVETDSKKSTIKYESFFTFSSTDERLAAGLAMFKPTESVDNERMTDANEYYDDARRQELKNIVKRKMKKSIQKALPRNVKPNRRFKRLAKNL